MTHAPVHDVDVLPEVELSVPGEHMRRNAQLVLGLATALHIPEEDIRASLLGYSGSWRRMEVVGTTADDVTVIDDYAHHPREISATIQAMREGYPGRRLVCVFQPHMHDRTLKLYDAFTTCFTGADLLMITDVYDARPDVETQKVSMTTFADDISRQSAVDVLYEGDLAATKERLLHDGLLQSHDILLCLGAGNITDMAREIGVAVQ
jgi:UDP-N-acetylmuramate--alanine ligase